MTHTQTQPFIVKDRNRIKAFVEPSGVSNLLGTDNAVACPPRIAGPGFRKTSRA